MTLRRKIMLISFDRIKNITVGAVAIDKNDHGDIKFSKCTKNQIDAWYAIGEIYGQRASMPTGVRLDFHTNSPYFSICMVGNGTYEVLINDVPVKRTEIVSTAPTVDKYDLPEQNDENRVTVVFPSHRTAHLRSLEVADGATLSPHKFDRKFIFYGDSITQGWNSQYDSVSYAYAVSRFFNADSVIQGIGGAGFQQSTFDPELPYDPDAVIIAYGTNDYVQRTSPDDYKAHVSDYLDRIRDFYVGKKVFVITPIWRADENDVRAAGSFKACVQTVKQESDARGFITIDGFTLTPHDPFFYADKYLHPNAAGFGIYAQNLIKELQKYI